MRELEIRFHVPPDSLQSLRQELNRHGARSTRMTAHYFDTPGDALGSQQMSLRLRKEGRRWFQTLKAQRSSSGVDRFEHNVALRVPPGTMPVLDIARYDGTEAGARLREVLGGATAEALVERHKSAAKSDLLQPLSNPKMARVLPSTNQGQGKLVLLVAQRPPVGTRLELFDGAKSLRVSVPAQVLGLPLMVVDVEPGQADSASSLGFLGLEVLMQPVR
jgi:hypothetical protein